MPTATTYIMLGQATELKVHLSPAWNDMTAKGETVYITKSFSSLSDGIRRDFSR